ncbi:capsular polysaccharide biosynthesis protein [Chachezhania sediminis]|uniref:capsular polysaccharide biosynthesis protein n=1 Tax=Chachezhania sediminis TaxID=2599291 RepID=UPI00131C0111|nr:capsular polysaccharide biosynthesis protein [Chachezhania sediminis]
MARGARTPPEGRLFVYNGGFLTQSRVRRILSLAGFDLRLGLPGPGDSVGLWGASPTAWRGTAVARRRHVPLVRVEDAFLRSLLPGRAGEPPLGLTVDRTGIHFDGRQPSDLETLLAAHPLDDPALLTRAQDGIARIREGHLGKYSAFDPGLPGPVPGYVLLIDQTAGDASLRASGADRTTFHQMLAAARRDHPDTPILIRTHPETRAGFRPGHFDDRDLPGVTLHTAPVSPWTLMEGAVDVYTVSSQLGFKAILAGHRPHVWGRPFYAGWGLTHDMQPLPRRGRALSPEQLFAAAMILYPLWYDAFRDTLCPFETALDNFEAATRAWRDDHSGWIASGMRLWKRRPLNAMFGSARRMIFTDDPARAKALANATGRRRMVWAGKAGPEHDGAVRVEDGFLRSRGLGAELVPPLSLVLDPDGIYYDPSGPSRLETLIASRSVLTPGQRSRAQALIARLTDAGLSKYNTGSPPPDLPRGHRILVPGQVEDDASILRGTGDIRTNRALLEAARGAHPGAVLIYKPHPDVEAGLRAGRIDATGLAEVTLTATDPARLLDDIDEVWTMTSALGFEALLRGRPVTTLGAPFYAGWGLTTDLGPVPDRRQAALNGRTLDLAGLVHAALIDYPRYRDPVTGQPCPVEVIVDRLTDGTVPLPGPMNRTLSKLQGLFASRAHLWR